MYKPAHSFVKLVAVSVDPRSLLNPTWFKSDYAEACVKPRNLATSRSLARLIFRLNVPVSSQAAEGLELLLGEAVLGRDVDCRSGGVDGGAHHVDGGERVERSSDGRVLVAEESHDDR